MAGEPDEYVPDLSFGDDGLWSPRAAGGRGLGDRRATPQAAPVRPRPRAADGPASFQASRSPRRSRSPVSVWQQSAAAWQEAGIDWLRPASSRGASVAAAAADDPRTEPIPVLPPTALPARPGRRLRPGAPQPEHPQPGHQHCRAAVRRPSGAAAGAVAGAGTAAGEARCARRGHRRGRDGADRGDGGERSAALGGKGMACGKAGPGRDTSTGRDRDKKASPGRDTKAGPGRDKKTSPGRRRAGGAWRGRRGVDRGRRALSSSSPGRWPVVGIARSGGGPAKPQFTLVTPDIRRRGGGRGAGRPGQPGPPRCWHR